MISSRRKSQIASVAGEVAGRQPSPALEQLSLAGQIEQPLNLGAALLLVFLEGPAQADAGLQQLQSWPQATALLSLLPTALKALLMLVAKALIAATAANAIIAAARAYSIRSWPESSRSKLRNTSFISTFLPVGFARQTRLAGSVSLRKYCR
ncbi:MAG: hypothetical protein WAL85_10515 [Candidatus Korobacteraceae bacterium]